MSELYSSRHEEHLDAFDFRTSEGLEGPSHEPQEPSTMKQEIKEILKKYRKGAQSTYNQAE